MRFQVMLFGTPLELTISEYDAEDDTAVFQVYSKPRTEYFEAPRDLPDETLVERAIGTIYSSGIEWWRRLPEKEENLK